MVTNGIRSEIELCRLNFSTAWQQKDGHYSPAVSRYTHAELSSGLPFYTDNEPVRFSRNKGQRHIWQGRVDVYAMRWMDRYNRMLDNGALANQKRLSAMRVTS
jgi:hypothetical protein